MPSDARAHPLAEIKRLYFNATRTTIARDVDRAIDLLKRMTSDDERDRAAVYMAGLADMRKEWNALARPATRPAKRKPRPKPRT